MVNGEWRIGDAYGNNPVPIPVLVKKGINRFLFAASRRAEAWGAAIVVNASTEWLDDLEIHANYRKDEVTPCGPIPPLGFRKLGFLITNDQVVTGNVSFNVSLQHKGNNFNVDK